MASRQEKLQWVDGLRGVASVLVVLTHLARGFDDDLFKSVSKDPYRDLAPGEVVTARYLQLPFLRVLVQGRIGVSIFSLVTGFVCALKPISQFRAGTPDAAFVGIAKSAFRRGPRLVIPATLSTFIAWLLCQFGLFAVGNRVEGFWLNFTSPKPTPYIGGAIKELVLNIITTWSRGWNAYDQNQWTLQPLLKGAFMVYIFLFATAYMKSRYRMMISLGMYTYYFISNDSAFGMQFFFGTFLSDLSQSPTHKAWLAARKWPGRFLSPLLLIIGLFLASYPEKNPEWRPWSNKMMEYGRSILPHDSDLPRYYTGLGLELIVLSIHLSPPTKAFLSNRYFLWFGKNSFAVYLTHGTVLRTVLVWMLFGTSLPPDVEKDGKMVPGPALKICGRIGWYFWVPVWLCIVYAIADRWTRYVDPWAARLTARMERYVFEDRYTSAGTAAAQQQAQRADKEHLSPLPR